MRTHVWRGFECMQTYIRRHHVDKNALALECVALVAATCAIELLLPWDLCLSTLR